MSSQKSRPKKKVVIDYETMSEEEILIECIKCDSVDIIDKLMDDFPTFDVNFPIYEYELNPPSSANKNNRTVVEPQEDVVCATPFTLAVKLGHLATVKCLLKHNAELNPKGIKGGDSVLHLAVIGNDIEMLKFLLEIEIVHPTKKEIRRIVERNTKNYDGKTPIQLAIEQYKPLLVELFLDKGVTYDFSSRNEHNRTLIHEAAFSGDLKMLTCLTQLGQDPGQIDDVTGQTVLHYAALGQKKDVFEFFIKRKVEPSFVSFEDHSGQSALSILLNLGNLELVKLLLTKMEADLHQIFEKDGLSIMHRAALENNKDLLEKLVSLKARISIVDRNGNTPLHSAVSASCLEATKFFVDKKAEITVANHYGNTPLHYAAYFGKEDMLGILLGKLEKKASAHIENNCMRTPLHEAASMGHIEVIKPLIAKGVDIHSEDINGMTALQISINEKHIPFAIELIRNGAAVERPYRSTFAQDVRRDCLFKDESDSSCNEREGQYNTILQQSICNGYEDLVAEMLNAGVDVERTDQRGYSPLHNAVLYNELNIVKLLTGNNSIVDKKDLVDGYTPLILAIQASNFDICQHLVTDCHASLDYADKLGRICLHYAARQTNIDIIQLLIEAGANANHVDRSNQTPLFEACASDNAFAVQSLLSQHASFSHTNDNGYTPLHVAVENGSASCVSILLQQGASMSVKDNSGRTPLIVASHSGQTYCGRLLVQAWNQLKQSGSVVSPCLRPILREE